MAKNEFAKVVARRYHMTNDTTKAWVEAIFGTLGEILASGEEVNLRGFGVFRQRQTRPKVGRNARTGEAVYIPEHRRIRFDLCEKLDLVLNGEAELEEFDREADGASSLFDDGDLTER